MKRRSGFWAATGTGLAMTLAACSSGPSTYEIQAEERDHLIDVRGHQGFEDDVVNDWISNHPNERLRELQSHEERGVFIGYIAVTKKNTKGGDVECERLEIGQTPTDTMAIDKWRAENAEKGPAERREEILYTAINNSSSTVAAGFLVCSAPFSR